MIVKRLFASFGPSRPNLRRRKMFRLLDASNVIEDSIVEETAEQVINPLSRMFYQPKVA